MSIRRRNKPTSEKKEWSMKTSPTLASAHLSTWQLRFCRQFFFSLLLFLVTLGTVYYRYARGASIFPSLNGSAELSCGSDPFEVVDIPGKGKGMVATRVIKQGELILREKPVFVVPHHVTSSPSALISQLLREARPKDRQAFWNLSYVNFPSNLKPEEHPDEVALAIFLTNSVAAGDGVAGIFPLMARLNHGCCSAFNAVYTWREGEGALVVHALKHIKKGEELLTSYTNTKRPRNERRAFLAKHYGFHCSCQVCSLPEAQSATSDKRLLEISENYDQLATWGSRRISGSDAIGIVKTIWQLGNEEGYWSERGVLAEDATWVAAAHSDAAGVREWGKLAIEWYTYEVGSDSEQVQKLKSVVKDPQSHFAWGTRELLEVGGPEA